MNGLDYIRIVNALGLDKMLAHFGLDVLRSLALFLAVVQGRIDDLIQQHPDLSPGQNPDGTSVGQ